MADPITTWGGSLHQTFRLLPIVATHVQPFLSSDGLKKEDVLSRLPYDSARSKKANPSGPDPKRYRDGKQVYQTAGLLYEGANGKVCVTEFGKTTLRWLDLINDKNRSILGRHAAYGLAACQLRNPTGAGKKYSDTMEVFPFSFIWQAMLGLDGSISSDEINRGIFKVTNQEQLGIAIEKIRESRDLGDVGILGDEVIQGRAKNDRIIPWMAIASFGWILFPDKRQAGGASYQLVTETLPILREAASVRHRHREFENVEDYVNYISRCSCVPRDLR